ncbi:cation-transporting P-type ATPase, partial [Clostridium chrysemydis]
MHYKKSIEEVINETSTNIREGLTSKEAKSRLLKNGENKLESKKNKSIFKIFLSQVNDSMIYILLFAAALSAFMG